MRHLSLHNPRLQVVVKTALLVGTGLFLYQRFATGTLAYYINERFTGFTLFGMVGLLVVGVAYVLAQLRAPAPDPDHAHDHGHNHGLSWAGVLVVALPKPLGVAALDNREMSLSLERSALPASIKRTGVKAPLDRTILDWWHTFQGTDDYSGLVGQEAKVIGFVYRDPKYGDGHFVATRFIVSCCVADAAVAALVVRWPETASLENDQWVEIQGVMAAGELADWRPPVLVARSITPVDIPEQPYLYP
jgi:uncharacterized repeat protein (TIGR03943 family)